MSSCDLCWPDGGACHCCTKDRFGCHAETYREPNPGACLIEQLPVTPSVLCEALWRPLNVHPVTEVNVAYTYERTHGPWLRWMRVISITEPQHLFSSRRQKLRTTNSLNVRPNSQIQLGEDNQLNKEFFFLPNKGMTPQVTDILETKKIENRKQKYGWKNNFLWVWGSL